MSHDLSGSFNDSSGNSRQNQEPTNNIVPSVIRDNPQGGRVVQDIYSALLSENVVFIQGVVEPHMANAAVATMFHLYYDKIRPHLYEETTDDNGQVIEEQKIPLEDVPEKLRTIKFLINSPGGYIDDGLQIYDVMQLLKNEGVIVETHVTGRAMSMGSVLLVAGSEGYRYAWPSANIMLHDASGGSSGKRADMKVGQEEIDYISKRMKAIYSVHTNITDDELEQLFSIPDYFIRAEEAKNLGIIDSIRYPANLESVSKMLKSENVRHWDGEEVVKKTKESRLRARP